MKRRDGTNREHRTKRPSTPGYVLIDSRPPNLLTRLASTAADRQGESSREPS